MFRSPGSFVWAVVQMSIQFIEPLLHLCVTQKTGLYHSLLSTDWGLRLSEFCSQVVCIFLSRAFCCDWQERENERYFFHLVLLIIYFLCAISTYKLISLFSGMKAHLILPRIPFINLPQFLSPVKKTIFQFKQRFVSSSKSESFGKLCCFNHHSEFLC